MADQKANSREKVRDVAIIVGGLVLTMVFLSFAMAVLMYTPAFAMLCVGIDSIVPR